MINDHLWGKGGWYIGLLLEEGGGKSFNVWEQGLKKDLLSALLLSKK